MFIYQCRTCGIRHVLMHKLCHGESKPCSRCTEAITRANRIKRGPSISSYGPAKGDPEPVKSDGGSSSYYELPPRARELQDLISHRNMNFAVGNIFKACWRLGRKSGTEALYDLRKIPFFAVAEAERISSKADFKSYLQGMQEEIAKRLAQLDS